MEDHLTPEIMRNYGFLYRPCGISGADMWQGMPFWTLYNDPNIMFRGSLSSTGRGSLHLMGYFNSNIETVQQLKDIYKLLTNRELVEKTL